MDKLKENIKVVEEYLTEAPESVKLAWQDVRESAELDLYSNKDLLVRHEPKRLWATTFELKEVEF